MEKSIKELNLVDLEAVVGGVDLSTLYTPSTVYKIPTGSMNGSMNQLPKAPRPSYPVAGSLI